MPTPKITQIELRGFKSIAYENPIRLTLRNVNILLGANGAGKSNIISFFKLLSNMLQGKLQIYIEQAGTAQQFLHYGAKRTPEISASFKIEMEETCATYHFNLAYAQPDRLVINREEVVDNAKGGYSTSVAATLREAGLPQANDSISKTIFALLQHCKTFQFHDTSATGSLRNASLADTPLYLQSEGNNLAAFLLFLRKEYPFHYNRIVSYVSLVVPQFSDFYLEPTGEYVSLKWTDTSTTDYVFTSNQFSDGSLRYIALATLLLQPPDTMPAVVIIDEPELGLHPFAIDQLAEMIKDASLHAQILVATQSPQLINHFSPENITIIDRNAKSQCSEATRLNPKQLSKWLEEYELSELWDKNVIGGRPQ